MNLNYYSVQSIAEIPKVTWNTLLNSKFPFLQYDFLLALEEAEITNRESGWQVSHLVLHDESSKDITVAILPLYLKTHSYGEFIFDHPWVNAYQRTIGRYYPKLLTASPYSPLEGPRLLSQSQDSLAEVASKLLVCVQDFAQQKNASSWHVLFPQEDLADVLSEWGVRKRKTVNFHWFNKGYKTFDDFLAGFASRKRKNLKKERASIAKQGISIESYEGEAITQEHWQCFYLCYQMTYLKRSGHGGYLSLDFFLQIAKTMKDALWMVLAKDSADNYVAAALNFKDDHALYGRYWGCLDEYDNLHFECCYYQGIEYCIENQLACFDPGVQGEHKIKRGFEPIYSYSNHWIFDEHFQQALDQFFVEEEKMVVKYKQETTAMLPFKSSNKQ